MPKIERAYLLKPYYGKIDKQKPKNFADIEAALHSEVPGPIYKTQIDWTKEHLFGKGRFLKCPRDIPESVLKKKEN